MNSLLPLFLKLRHTSKVVKESTSQLQVIVIGPKNSGKSSVIECLIGNFFIPRDGLIQCPLIINVKYSETGNNYITFEDSPHKKFTDFDEAGKEIYERSAQKNTGTSEGSLKPIILELHCQHIVDMTFIKLPAIEAKDDTFVDVKEFFKSYLSLDNVIVLIVAPAHNYVEFKNSALFKLAEEKKRQTIVLYTHLDCFALGQNLKHFFDNLPPHNYLHVAGVFCRVGKNFKGKKKIEDIRKIERKFFRLKNLPHSHLHGTEKLLHIFGQIIKNRWQINLPKCLHSLNLAINSVKTELSSGVKEKLDADKLILEELTCFANHFISLLSGRNLDVEKKTLVGGARISFIFRELFSNSLDALNPLTGLNRSNILAALRNTCGTHPEAIFVSEACFEALARRQISLFKDSCYYCVELVYEEMLKIKTESSNCLKTNNFPQICDVLIKTTEELIDTYNLCHNLVEELLNMESAFISTVDSDFEKNVELNISNWFGLLSPPSISDEIPKGEESDPRFLTFSGSNWLSCLLSPKYSEKIVSDVSYQAVPSSTPHILKLSCISSKDNADCELLENLVAAYFSTVRRSLKDSIPKAIMLRMVNYVRDHLYHTLLERVQMEKHYVTDFINGVLEERKKKVIYLQELCESNNILKEIINQL